MLYLKYYLEKMFASFSNISLKSLYKNSEHFTHLKREYS